MIFNQENALKCKLYRLLKVGLMMQEIASSKSKIFCWRTPRPPFDELSPLKKMPLNVVLYRLPKVGLVMQKIAS